MKPSLKQYGFWEEENGAESNGYWVLFDELKDAVHEARDRPVHELTASNPQFYEIKTSIVKRKKGK